MVNELLVEERNELQNHEQVIEQGLKTFVDVGNALLAIRDKRLYRGRWGTFEEYCGERWGFTSTHAKRLVDSAIIAKNLEPLGETNFSERHLRPLKNLQPEQQREVYQRAVETAPNGKVTAAHVEATVRSVIAPVSPTVQPTTVVTYNSTQANEIDTKTIFAPEELSSDDEVDGADDEIDEDEAGYDWTGEEEEEIEPDPKPIPVAHHRNAYATGSSYPAIVAPIVPNHMAVHFSSESPEHYTPREIIDAALAVLGAIDLDPCSNSKESPNVPALDHYTASDDGLSMPWFGRVYMNPPYGRVIGGWIEKLVAEYEAGNVTEAIALVPARTDTQWIADLDPFHCCYVRGRLTFIGNDDPAPFPSVVYYLGQNTTQFFRVFRNLGSIKVELDEHWFTD